MNSQVSTIYIRTFLGLILCHTKSGNHSTVQYELHGWCTLAVPIWHIKTRLLCAGGNSSRRKKDLISNPQTPPLDNTCIVTT
jgi:hypothetical protein